MNTRPIIVGSIRSPNELLSTFNCRVHAEPEHWDGALQAALDSCARAAALGERSGNPNARATTLYQRYRILRMLGRNEEVIAGMTEMQGLFRGTPVMENYMQIIVAGNLLDVGQRDAALRCFNEDAVSAGMAMGEPSILEPLAELGLATGDKSLATAIRDRVASVPEHLIGGGPLTLTWDSPVHRVLALTNQTLGDNDAAVRHYEAGAALARRLGGEPIATRMRTELGEFLCSIERRDDARSVLATAAEDAASMSMAAIAQRARAALEALDTPRKVAPMAPVTEPLCFDPEGHVWRVRYQARELRIKDSKGVRFVASLVSQPRKAMHVLDLAAPSARHEVDDEGAEILDATARDAYKARIEVLRDQLDEAEGFNDPGRAATARAEMDTLVTELSKGLGLSGRGRQFSTNAERARVNVQRRIRDAIRRIGELDKPLARHLDRCIRTGTHCSYDPE